MPTGMELVPFAMTATVVGLNVVESAPQTGRIGMSRQRVKTKNTKNFCIEAPYEGAVPPSD